MDLTVLCCVQWSFRAFNAKKWKQWLYAVGRGGGGLCVCVCDILTVPSPVDGLPWTFRHVTLAQLTDKTQHVR